MIRDNNTKKVLFVASIYMHFTAFHMPFIRLFQDWGYQVHAAALPYINDREELERQGIICWDIPFSRSPFSLRNVQAFFKLRDLLKRERYDLIHVHTPVASWVTRFTAKLYGQGPVLYTAHGFHFFKGAPWYYWLLFYPAEWIASKWTDGLIVINSEDLQRAKDFGFVEGKNLFFVHGVGIDLEKFSKLPTQKETVKKHLGINRDYVVVTCIAEFTKNKNHQLLLEAWKLLGEKTKKAVLLLVGDGVLRKETEHKTKSQNISNVVFLGFRKDIPEILSITDVFVLPSKREGLPRAIMEAMASGIPVVATDVRGSRDLVDDGITGFLIKLGDVKDFANKLWMLIENPDLRDQMGKAAKEKIKAYSSNRVLEEMKDIYSRFLNIK